MNKDFTVASLDESKLSELRRLEAELSAEFGKEIVLIAWEKELK